MQIAFWSPYHGQTGTTTAAVAYGVMTALLNNYKVLLAHSQFERSTMERCLVRSTHETSEVTAAFRDHGMEALRRLARNGRLTDGMIRDYTTGLLPEMNLDLLEGTVGHEHVMAEEEIKVLRRIYRTANMEYDLVFVDVHSGMKRELTRSLLEESDVVVVCLNQNVHLIDHYMGDAESQTILAGKQIITNMGFYDHSSRFRQRNIMKHYGFDQMITLPYHTEYRDACNGHLALDYLMRHFEATKKDSAYEFVNALKHGVSILMEEIEKPEQEVLKAHG